MEPLLEPRTPPPCSTGSCHLAAACQAEVVLSRRWLRNASCRVLSEADADEGMARRSEMANAYRPASCGDALAMPGRRATNTKPSVAHPPTITWATLAAPRHLREGVNTTTASPHDDRSYSGCLRPQLDEDLARGRRQRCQSLQALIGEDRGLASCPRYRAYRLQSAPYFFHHAEGATPLAASEATAPGARRPATTATHALRSPR
jgi:hypothetical protein